MKSWSIDDDAGHAGRGKAIDASETGCRPTTKQIEVTRKVLIVDDNEQVLKLVQRQLTGTEYVVATAIGPEQAIAWCRQFGAPDLLVSDVRMPLMSGPRLYDRLRETFGDFPVLFISGDTGGDGPDATRQLLEKPFSRRELIDAINAQFTSED